MAKKMRSSEADVNSAKFPRHDVEKALRIPRAILEQNAGKACTDKESAEFVGVGYNGPYAVELSSSLKYGFLERPQSGKVAVTERARKAIRPQKDGDEIEALRDAVVSAADISAVYKHYRGENLPDSKFLDNALTDKFNIPAEKTAEFQKILIASLRSAKLLDETGGKIRIIDVSQAAQRPEKKLEATLNADSAVVSESEDTCFVVMPFASPIGNYFKLLYEPAIQQAGLTAVRADADIFGAGKIMDQIWRGINDAKVLVAELTNRNPNVFYELGLAHALSKPVVLVSSKQEDVPFDLKHIRVIYYDMSDPFWGEKLIKKVAENIQSALSDPEEATFKNVLEKEAKN